MVAKLTAEASIKKYPAGCKCRIKCRHFDEVMERIDTFFGCWSYVCGNKLADGHRACLSDELPCDAEITVYKYPRLKTWWLRFRRFINIPAKIKYANPYIVFPWLATVIGKEEADKACRAALEEAEGAE